MIIDCHVHLNRYEDESKPALPRQLEALLLDMRRNRVDVALALTSYKDGPGRPSVREVVRAVRDLRGVKVIAGVSYLRRGEQDLSELRDYLQAGIVRGLKFYPGYEPFYPADPEMRPAVELALEFGVPLMIHSGDTFTPRGRIKFSHPLHVDDLAVDHPELKIVICHLGNPWLRDCMEVVYKNSNVYADISGLVLGDFSDRFEIYMRRQLQDMLLYGVEPEKVLYGTDWPIASMESYLRFIGELAIPEEDLRRILWDNSAGLFGLRESDSMFPPA